MKILVTGGCGFIGSHVVGELIDRGHEVEVMSRPNCNLSNLSGHKGLVHHNADISNRERVFSGIKKGIDGVIHIAALVNVDQSRIEPLKFLDVNVGGTANVLEASRIAGVSRFLQMSTCEVYGNIPVGLATEEHALNPRSPYAVSKLAAEKYVQAFAFTYPEMNIRIIRGFNQYGPRQSGEKFGAVIPKFINFALKGEKIRIFGDGKQTRDYVYIEDSMKGICDAFEEDLPNAEIINLATERDETVNELAETVCRLAGRDPKQFIERIDARPGELVRSIGDSSKARKLLGWKAKINFEEGMKRTFEWFKAQKR
ncbi:MAG: GDP-mannose 4,6-dehydratase [Candidatus Micrarchaeota archaeon]